MTDTDYQPIGRIKGHPRVRRPRLPRPGAVRHSGHNQDTPNAGSAAHAPSPRGIAEWHSMSPAERAVNWAELCGWVVWLYDRYELSVESRLPECWADHPGMIEELWALMTWRKEIYNSEQPAGQAARYWHTELRAVTANAATYYASQCRTGHKGASGGAANSLDLQRQWLKADPLLGIPQSLLAAPAEDEQHLPDTMTGSEMKAALANGEAKRLSPAIPEYALLQGSWWLDGGEDRWVLVADDVFAAKLDASAAAMAEATAATQRRRAARDLFGEAPADDEPGSRN